MAASRSHRRGGISRGRFRPRAQPAAPNKSRRRVLAEEDTSLLSKDRHQENTMDDNRITGTAKNVGGNVQEAAGKLTGDTKLQAKGAVNQAAGDMEELYGQAKDAAADVA